MNYRKVFEKFKNKLKEEQFSKGLLTIVMIAILSFLLMSITFIYSSPSFNAALFSSYFRGRWLMLMNFIPIFLLLLFLSLIFNRLWISFALSSVVFFLMSTVNKFKLIYRDEPLTITDIALFIESVDMASKYEIRFDSTMILIIIGLLIITLLLRRFITYSIRSKRITATYLILTILISVIIFKGFYLNPSIYERVGDKGLINIWSQSQQFQSKGLVYPFIYSVTDLKDRILEGYDEDKARSVIDKRNYNHIAEDEKVNIIAIMLESYNDFSKFESIELNIDIYENYHNIKEESYNGTLITNVFAGGTINTEWSFLTGYNSHPKYIKDTNSFVRYFNEQGYKTEAMHPNYGWFYNRRNVNDYIGFDNFDYYENRYQEKQEDFLEDMDFFDYIIEGYEESKSEGKPYFNFSLTYQNHGPYSPHKLTDSEYLKRKAHYDEANYNIINNYFSGIKKTDEAINKLIDYYNQEDEPTIIILFGDHNPWLGENSVGYDMLGIDIDFSTVEGFVNYYETPYLIWGNPSCKDVLDRDFMEEGNTISPNFLMAELFQYLGWGGNEYMEYIRYVKDNFDVNHDMYFKEDGEFTRKLSEDKDPIWKEFNYVQYYHSRNLSHMWD